jgi:SNF2 family DNA or RNA helicase
MLKFKNFLARAGLDEKPFQMECFQWCLAREETHAEPVHAEPVHIALNGGCGGIPQDVEGAAPLNGGCGGIPQGCGGIPQGVEGAAPLGGILALEMGLGKTIIMLGLIECHFQRHTLIILPLALLYQWEKCIINYFGHQPLVYHGSRPKSLKLSLLEISQKPIVLTTYGQISLPSKKQINRGRTSSLLHKIQWDRVICDEGHHVSHKRTNEFKGVQALPARIHWLVTGTPIQNNEEELYNLFTLLGFAHHKSYYYDPVNYQDAVQRFVFHKTKANAGIKLPKLHEHLEIVQWENESERQFSSHIHSLLTFCNITKQSIASEMETETELGILRMQYLSKSRQVCIYPSMLKSTIQNFEKKLHKASADDNSYAGLEIAELYVSESKINAVIKTLLERRGNGCGKIVFCHYYAEIDIIAKRLLEHDGNIKISKFDGRLKTDKIKQQILSDPTIEVLLAQIKTCREGLNLQDNYSEVYFPSPHFNPATEDQSIARCWRIGQKKEVFVFRYIMVETERQFPTAQAEQTQAEQTQAEQTQAEQTQAEQTQAEQTQAEQAQAEQTQAEQEEEEQEQAPAPLQTYSMDSYSFCLQSRKREIIAKFEEAAMQAKYKRSKV